MQAIRPYAAWTKIIAKHAAALYLLQASVGFIGGFVYSLYSLQG